MSAPTPLYAIRCLYGPGANDLRAAARDEHVSYLRANAHRIRFSGPLLLDEGTPAGLLSIVEVADRAGAQDFIDQESFRKAGMFESIEITRFSSLLNHRMVDLQPQDSQRQFLAQWATAATPTIGDQRVPQAQPNDAGATLLEAGPRLSDDGTQVIGGLLILEAIDRGSATEAAAAAASAGDAGYTDLVVQRWRFGKALSG